MPKKKAKQVPELRVVLDTNAVYTASASYAVGKEVSDLITDNSTHADLKVRWFLPAIVRHERQYQMIRQALGFLPTVQKLERLLGINLNITADILELRVREAIDRHVSTLGVEIAELQTDAPNWGQIVLDAAYRRPPFEAGDKEKGFRDAIVLETFLQLVEQSPQSPKSCRLALVSGDKLLLQAAEARTTGAANVRLFASVEELHGLINTLVSEVDEEFVQHLTPQAQKIFFVVKDRDTLYYSEDMWATISARLSNDIGPLPGGAERQQSAGITINQPRFARKDRQTIHWSSRIEIKLEAIKSSPSPKPALFEWSMLKPSALSEASWLTASKPPDIIYSASAKPIVSDISNYVIDPSSLGLSPAPQIVARGQAAYDVFWKTTVSTARRLTHPVVERIQFVEVSWS